MKLNVACRYCLMLELRLRVPASRMNCRMVTVEMPSSAIDADEESLARDRLAAIPGFDGHRASRARLTRLVGMTNRVYKVESEGERFCLRIPGGGGAAAKIDRRAEEVNARLAATAGVAPEVLYFDADGLMLTRFLDAEPASPRPTAG